jgi:hypothetical protein
MTKPSTTFPTIAGKQIYVVGRLVQTLEPWL